ncbi:hypothetical protein GWK08_13160 [Leptobacterium flavescens]|uniref:DUF6438 domain-containing protein n=1 Tax=Leptobacterium flavescens TaxID=472055 RepID=A0A6P0UVG4_9FLAO|nr:DUF6438 domain-containing protein [Leptobacterium flavescens]NER14396.1 hypothetical protein [Leptobacterium flavescens]
MKKLICMSLILLYGSCAAQKEVLLDNQNLKFGLSKTRCLGKCPVYHFKVYENGDMVYHGIENVDKEGTHMLKLSSAEMEELEQAFTKIGFKSLELPRKGVIRDMPFTILTFEGKKLRYQPGGSTKELKNLVLRIEEMIVGKIGV